ncbi:DUF2264 domain-containing protein [Psychromicrobium lacuslunae]|uniref:DUF2264 domain-containing protein n=1 Tax=Psychromicrobium lacuslunae TaxID=1618207 RepID=A0A0D4C1L1_9MICC|nr:DUF2264 domain-containing protein [Psychromicrobium lacuslunae]AJT42241.1 hypothetical protein UM93_13400 [Psychromicrobium lacuslunae]
MSPSPFALPALDPVLSARTGWTREHWWRTADRWLAPVLAAASPGHALPVLPGRVTRDGERRESMELIGRSLLLAAPRIAGAHQSTSSAEERADGERLAAWYRQALISGTSPDGPEAWPLGVSCRTPLQGVTNSIVEAANISYALATATEQLWEPLSDSEKAQLAAWLRHHASLEVWQNNWQLFPALAEGFLRSVGEDVRGLHNSRNVARVEGWYTNEGWYTDGPEHAYDYYNAWAIHPYLEAWYRLTGTTQSAEGQRHLGRLSEFVAGFGSFVADDGSLLHFGRSLSYRTAALAALWSAEAAGVNPLGPGESRALASAVLSRFIDRGVGVDEPLSLGWYQPHLGSCQSYSGFGSPFLAGIGFSGLALPADHPVWTKPEPSAETTNAAAVIRSVPDLGWSLARADGVVRLINHGSDHCWLPVEGGADPDDPHYAKFAYSSHTAPGTGAAWRDNIDGHLALLNADGVASRRAALRGTRSEGAISGSVQLPQLNGKTLPGSAVLTVSILHADHELRCHLVYGAEHYSLREGSFALAAEQPPELSIEGLAARLETAELRSGLLGLHGWQSISSARYQGCNALGEHSAVAFLQATGSPGPTVYIALHSLGRSAPPRQAAEVVRVEVAGSSVHWNWVDGESGTVDIASFVPWDGVLKGFSERVIG